MTGSCPAILAALALASLCASRLAAQASDGPDVGAKAEAAPQTRGEARLAKLLEGRVAGEPVSCIRTLRSQRIQTIDGTAYVYGSGDTIYVQRTRSPDKIRGNDALVANRFEATQMCRYDIVTTIDPMTGATTGVAFFEDFVPYTRIKTTAAAEG